MNPTLLTRLDVLKEEYDCASRRLAEELTREFPVGALVRATMFDWSDIGTVSEIVSCTDPTRVSVRLGPGRLIRVLYTDCKRIPS